MILSEREKQLVLEDRKRVNEQREYVKKQKSCEHNFVYSGHSHNDDCYTCTKCGLDDWR